MINFQTERIIEQLGGTDEYPLLLTLTGFSNGPIKWDIRRWRRENDGTLQPLKGVGLFGNEADALLHALSAALGTQQDQQQTQPPDDNTQTQTTTQPTTSEKEGINHD